MHFSVGLQESFDYALIFMLVAGGLILLSMVLFMIYFKLTGKDFSGVAEKLRKLFLGKTRRKYIRQIEDVERYFVNGKKDTRTVHQEMSLIVRKFVYAATGVHVDRLCYTEIKRLKMNSLTKLVREFYEPEFSVISDADAAKAIRESKEMIKRWE